MDRRTFLVRQMRGAAWLAAGGAGSILLPRDGFAAEPDLAVAKGADPAANTRAAVDLLGGIKAFVRPGMRVVIKPNMSFPHPAEEGTNTHPMVVQTLAILCKEAGASSILVLDNTLARPAACLEKSGIESAVNGAIGKAVYTINDTGFFRETALAGGKVLNHNGIATEVLRADVLIAAPTAKSHSATGVSLALKGMMGLVADRNAMHRASLDEAIVDLCGTLKAQLTVIDATYVLTSGGPFGPGKVEHAKTVIASRDVVAADAYTVQAFEWYGRRYKPAQVGHIRRAHERGLGRMDVEKLTVRTVDLA